MKISNIVQSAIMSRLVILVSIIAVAVALPTKDRVIRALEPGPRYQYVQAADGTPHLADLWLKTSDLEEASRYEPDRQNVYHLFTRDNPTASQPLLMGVEGLLGLTNYDSQRRTVVLLHGWLDTVTANANAVLTKAFLDAENVNVIVVDWSAGAASVNYIAAMRNTVLAGESVARFLAWLNQVTGAVPLLYHIVGHNLGGHMAGVVGRNLGGELAYITALEPMFTGWITNSNRFNRNDGRYTEVIHTNAGVLGYLGTLGDADFYPNGGISMPGCNSNECDHARSYYYFAESLTRGGFTGQRCATFITAMTGTCYLWGNLHMGGLTPKTGSSGIFWLQTNASPPFSRG